MHPPSQPAKQVQYSTSFHIGIRYQTPFMIFGPQLYRHEGGGSRIPASTDRLAWKWSPANRTTAASHLAESIRASRCFATRLA